MDDDGPDAVKRIVKSSTSTDGASDNYLEVLSPSSKTTHRLPHDSLKRLNSRRGGYNNDNFARIEDAPLSRTVRMQGMF